MDAKSEKLSSWLLSQLKQGVNRDQFQKAVWDVREGWKRRALWGTIALHDIRQRYRRSFLGPLWITLTMGIMVGALGTLYAKIFGVELASYLPYLSAGFVAWALISGFVLEGAKTYTSSDSMLRQMAVPISVFVYRSVWRDLLIFFHNIWIYVIVAFIFQVNPGWYALLCVPALLLLLMNGVWIGILLGLLSARFRDIPLIMASIVQIMFFITPIIWKTEMLPGRALLLDLNPFYHFIEIFRAPILGQMPSLESWLAVLLITVVGWGTTMFFYTAYRWRIVYWV